MTTPFYGSSLFQARKTDHVHRHSHSHLHNSSRKSDQAHIRSHAEFHNHDHEHDRRDEPGAAVLDRRGSTITEVVQTISVVQIIDGAGATLSAQTLTGSSQTDLVDAETGSTLVVAFKDAVATSTDADGASTDTSSDATATATETATSTADPVSDTSITPTSLPPELSLTQISSSSSSSFSTLSSTSNSTTSSLTSSTSSFSSSLLPSTNSTHTSSGSLYSSSTHSQSPVSSSSSFLLTLTTFASSTLSSSSPLSSPTSIWTEGPSTTGWITPSDSASASYGAGGDGSNDGSGTAAGTGTASASTSSSTSASSASGSSTPETSTVVGGIFGGIAGVALLVAVAFMILRLRKQGWCHVKLGSGEDEPNAASRPLPAPSGGGGGGGAGGAGGGDAGAGSGAYGTMQQRSAPQAVAASLAALAGKRTSRERAGSGPGMAERGFVRVSGKKLPPVLQYGGDGYTDPRLGPGPDRSSHISDASASVYRDSVAVFDQPNHQRLALGSPMRPESGIMTMHPSPAKTPVTGQAPGHIDVPSLPRSSTFPSTDVLGRTLEGEDFSRDAIGRTLAANDVSRDGAASGASRGSHTSRGSTRFTEHVS